MRYAERLATDYETVDEAFKTELREHFDEGELIELGMMIGQYIAFGRLLVIHDLHQAACKVYTPPS